jgi:hypothetical protein
MPTLVSRALTRRTVRTTQLTSGIGFFAVLPFLAEHLAPRSGMVGFVLGLRTFSQQGLFMVGGALALCCAYGTYLLAYNQLYLALPDEVRRATGSQAALSWLFALSSLLVVCAQLPLTHWAGDRLGLRRSMIAGLLCRTA